jgi:hypothetical protein
LAEVFNFPFFENFAMNLTVLAEITLPVDLWKASQAEIRSSVN